MGTFSTEWSVSTEAWHTSTKSTTRHVVYYPSTIEYSKGHYQVHFPDFPNLHVEGGQDFNEVKEEAVRVLETYISSLNDFPIPQLQKGSGFRVAVDVSKFLVD